MKKLFIVFLSLIVISACDNTKRDFPGFKEVEVPGEANVYMYDPSTLLQKRLPNRKERVSAFTMLKKLEDGYVIQEAATDCIDDVTIKDGYFYSYKDGTSKEYPGGNEPFKTGNDPHLRMLVKAVCPKAEEGVSNTLTGAEKGIGKIIAYKDKQAGFLTKEGHARTDFNDDKSEVIFIKNGSEVTVSGASDNGEWLEFEYGGHAGKLYIRAENVAVFQ